MLLIKREEGIDSPSMQSIILASEFFSLVFGVCGVALSVITIAAEGVYFYYGSESPVFFRLSIIPIVTFLLLGGPRGARMLAEAYVYIERLLIAAYRFVAKTEFYATVTLVTVHLCSAVLCYCIGSYSVYLYPEYALYSAIVPSTKWLYCFAIIGISSYLLLILVFATSLLYGSGQERHILGLWRKTEARIGGHAYEISMVILCATVSYIVLHVINGIYSTASAQGTDSSINMLRSIVVPALLWHAFEVMVSMGGVVLCCPLYFSKKIRNKHDRN